MPEIEPTNTAAADSVYYDLIYRDMERINSLYAQMFQGRITSIEENDTARDNTNHTARVGVPGTGVETQLLAETQSTSRKTFDPHDTITTSLLLNLSSSGRICRDWQNAPPSSIVTVKGTLMLLPATVSILALKFYVENMPSQTSAQKAEKKSYQSIFSMLAENQIPSFYTIATDDSDIVCGVVRESGMLDPISSFFYNHAGGLADVDVIGIKEHTVPVPAVLSSPVYTGAQTMAGGLREMFLPDPNAQRITPLVIMRTVGEFVEEASVSTR